MRRTVRAACHALVLVLWIVGLADYACAQESTAAATRQYNAAVALQNHDAYLPAAQQWAKFIDTYRSDPRCDRAFHNLGICYLKADKLDLARQCFEIVVKNYPKFDLLDATYLYLGVTQYNLARSGKVEMYDAAAATFHTVITKYPESTHVAQALFYRGECLYHRGKKQEAAEMYTRLLARFPDDKLAVNARYMAGFTAFGQGDFPTALKHAEAFLAAYPDDERAADTLYVAAESHLQLGQYVEADRLFAVLLRKHSNHADANIWKVRYASSLYLQKKYAEAVALLQPLPAGLRTPDALAEAHYLLGGSQVELNEFEAAAKSLEASLAAQPKWRQADDALLLLAQAYTGLKNGQKARATLEKLIAQFPDSRLLDRAHYRLGEIAYAGSDFQTATAEYQQVIDRWPQSPMAPHALYGLGWTKLGQNDFAAAEKVFDQWVREYPDHLLVPRVRYARGVARHELKNFAGAIDDIQALLESDPTRAEKSDARYLLGLCQSALQRYADAAATFQTLLADDPKYAAADKALYELAWALKRQDKEKQAAAVFARLAAAYAGSPLTAEAQYRVGQYSEQSGDLKNAAAAYHAAWQAAGRFAQTDLADKAAFSEGESLWKQKTFADALAAYEQVKEPAGKDFELLALLHAGQAAAEVAQWDKSLGFLTKCIERFPDSPDLPDALCEQGWVLQNLGKLDKAEALYAQVLAKTDREAAARAQFLIGQLQFQRKDYAEANKSFLKVSYGYSYPQWQAAAAYEAGRCFEALGQGERAVKQYRELIAQYPQSDKASLAKQRLKELLH